ncbi:MAG TPA: alpha/beta fold hydrolase [Rubrobacteraceae bacterium]|jgi:3-oxoadipate enol-lactonase|nr:alpha/beta fold hydrolase [Rubrobacteraceae bacterium]
MASGAMMSYRELGEGSGDPLVLLHAFPLNGRMFEPQMEAFSGERRVVAPDYPGFGRSPRTPAQPDVRYYAEAVGGLLDRLGLERVVLGGVSMGGYVAFGCLRLFPQRISGLVLANTRPEPDSDEIRENRKEMARRVADEGVEVLVELQMERLLARDTLENNEEVVERVRAMILESSPGGVVAALGAMRNRPDSTPLLAEIEVPTLVIGGEEDGISSPEVMGAMAQKIPNSRHVTLPRAGHLSNLENPEGFNAALGELLG